MEAARSGSAISDDEEVVVVVDQLEGRGHHAAQLPAASANELAHLGLELGDECRDLLFGPQRREALRLVRGQRFLLARARRQNIRPASAGGMRWWRASV